MKRVYHPNLSSWYDVPEDQVDAWAEAGWVDKRPEKFHSEDEKNLDVGEGYEPPPTIGLDAPDDVSVLTAPGGNASTDEWRGYAIAQGATESELEGLSRDELRTTYGTPAE